MQIIEKKYDLVHQKKGFSTNTSHNNKMSQPGILGKRHFKFSLFLNQNTCYRYSKEPSHLDGSFVYPHHMFWMRH